MKLTTFRSGDDDFEEEKLKIFEKEEVKVMDILDMSLTKKKQLEISFKALLKDMVNKLYSTIENNEEIVINQTVNLLLEEVKIRTKL